MTRFEKKKNKIMKDLFRRVVVCQGQRIINNVIIKKRRKNRGQFGKKIGWAGEVA